MLLFTVVCEMSILKRIRVFSPNTIGHGLWNVLLITWNMTGCSLVTDPKDTLILSVPRSGMESLVKLHRVTFVGLIFCLILFHSLPKSVFRWSSVISGTSQPLSTIASDLPQVFDPLIVMLTSAYNFFVSSGFGARYVRTCGLLND